MSAERQCLDGDTVRPCPVAALEAEVAELRSELAANAHACGVQMDQARRAEAEAARLRQALAGLLQVTADVDGVSDDMPAQIGTTMGAVRRCRAALGGGGVMDKLDLEAIRVIERLAEANTENLRMVVLGSDCLALCDEVERLRALLTEALDEWLSAYQCESMQEGDRLAEFEQRARAALTGGGE